MKETNKKTRKNIKESLKLTTLGFTLVELLAVIVILAIILVIAVPKVMNVIKDTTKASLESSAKMVASQVENQYTVAQTLGKEFGDTGSCMQDWAGLNESDYASCKYEVDDKGNALVTLTGKGKFKGLSVCNATRSEATAIEGECEPTVNAVSFSSDDWETIVAAVQTGNYPYEVGDTKSIDLGDDLGEHTIRVANTTPCSEVSVESKTACGFVLEFVDIVTSRTMNGYIDFSQSNTNAGGWPESEMYGHVNETIYNTIPLELRNGIIDTYVVSSHGIETITGYENVVDGNFYSTDKLYLLSPQEVYGTSFTNQYDSSNGTSRQLDYYATYEGTNYTGVSTTNYEGAIKNDESGEAVAWWLRTADSDSVSYFFYVNRVGDWSSGRSAVSYSVSPAFRLSN